jgi:penicillin-binding protein 1C
MGNFDNTPSRALVGGERAGPVLFDLMDALSNRAQPSASAGPPADLVEVEICAYSGRLATAACPHRSHALAPMTAVPTERCSFHQKVAVDDHTGHRLCPVCRQGRELHEETFVVLPAGVRRHLRERIPSLPSHLPACPHVVAAAEPRIVSPQPQTTIVLIPGLRAEDQEIPLEAEVPGTSSSVFWFVNGKLLAQAAPTERVWLKPEPGEHEILVTDAAGRSDRLRLRVE